MICIHILTYIYINIYKYVFMSIQKNHGTVANFSMLMSLVSTHGHKKLYPHGPTDENSVQFLLSARGCLAASHGVEGVWHARARACLNHIEPNLLLEPGPTRVDDGEIMFETQLVKQLFSISNMLYQDLFSFVPSYMLQVLTTRIAQPPQ